jgi:hypothetical protein
MPRITCVSFVLVLGLAINIGHAADKIQRDKNKPNTPTPADRVEQLLHTLQEDRKEEHRAKAAEDLLNFSSEEFPEIAPALINVLVRDTSPAVRKAVVKTLADVKPPTHEIKDALEQAVKQDKSWSVRQAARWASWRYKPKEEAPAKREPSRQLTSKPALTAKTVSDDKSKTKPAINEDAVRELPKLIAPPIPAVPAEAAPPPPPLVPLPGGTSAAPPPPTVVP